MSPELAGRFLTTGQQGKSQVACLNTYIQVVLHIKGNMYLGIFQ